MSESNSSSLASPTSATAKNSAAPATGQRKLVRPTLSAAALAEHRHPFPHNGSEVLTTRANRSAAYSEDSHAESFYFQKQMQTQTRMVVVLLDGEQIEGTLEWYDHHAIKLRSGNRRRTMIYKAGIKYLYKKAEEKTQHSIMQ